VTSKYSLVGNNLIIPAIESLVSDSQLLPAGDNLIIPGQGEFGL
jgi:phosphohistidine swiveling domain-containing protein